jgi:hypothetical protein
MADQHHPRKTKTTAKASSKPSPKSSANHLADPVSDSAPDSALVTMNRPEFLPASRLSHYDFPILIIRWKPGMHSLRDIRFHQPGYFKPEPGTFDVAIKENPYQVDHRLGRRLKIDAYDTVVQLVSKLAEETPFEYWFYSRHWGCLQIRAHLDVSRTNYAPIGGLEIEDIRKLGLGWH